MKPLHFNSLILSSFLPDYAMILNITNDHIDWHGSMKNYKDSKFKIFKNQKSYQYSLVTKKLFAEFKKRNLQGKIIIPKSKYYSRIKSKIRILTLVRY